MVRRLKQKMVAWKNMLVIFWLRIRFYVRHLKSTPPMKQESVRYGGVFFPTDYSVSLPYRGQEAYFAYLLLEATVLPSDSLLLIDSPYDYHVLALKRCKVPIGSIVSYQSDSTMKERIERCYASNGLVSEVRYKALSASSGRAKSNANKNLFWDVGFEQELVNTTIETFPLADELKTLDEAPDYLFLCINIMNVSILMETEVLSQFSKVLAFCDNSYFYSSLMRSALQTLQEDGWQISQYPQQIFLLKKNAIEFEKSRKI